MAEPIFKGKFNKPFFAYGVFKPNQVAYSLIEEYVDNFKKFELNNYSLLHRNGMPMITRGRGKTEGYLIKFKENYCNVAYNLISKSKSKSLYEWKVVIIDFEPINCLLAVNEGLGKDYGSTCYSGINDLGFCETLDYIRTNIDKFESGEFKSNNDFLFLQMNYMLLWGVIDKYTSSRYGGWGQVENVKKLSKEKYFREGLKKVRPDYSSVYSSRSDDEYILNLNRKGNKKYFDAANYYYHIRCNITHGGKVSWDNAEHLKYDLGNLLEIMEYILDKSFFKFSEYELEKGYKYKG